jgi:hypothetical protein
VYASHERAVQVIRNAADQLVLTVITVAAKEISEPQVAANRLMMTPGKKFRSSFIRYIQFLEVLLDR